MARGRIINSTICMDKRVSDLSDDTSRLAFTWLVTFADCEGRTQGDPDLLCSMLFPRRRDMPTAQMEEYVREWANSGMLVWYKVENDMWIEFLNFDKNQPNLRKDREPDSVIPSPVDGEILAGCLPDDYRQTAGCLPDDCRQDDGVTPTNIPPKIREEKLSEAEVKRSEVEVKRREDKSAPASDYVSLAVRSYENTIGLISGAHQRDEMLEYINDLHEKGADDWWQTAIDISADNNKRAWSYIRAILDNSLRDNKPPGRGGKPQQASKAAAQGYVVGPRWG